MLVTLLIQNHKLTKGVVLMFILVYLIYPLQNIRGWLLVDEYQLNEAIERRIKLEWYESPIVY